MEPPKSFPCAIQPTPTATELALPPLEPPGESSAFHGLSVVPKISFSV